MFHEGRIKASAGGAGQGAARLRIVGQSAKDRLLAGRQVGRRAAFHSSQELAGQVREKRSQFRIDWSSFALRAGLGGGLGPRQRRR